MGPLGVAVYASIPGGILLEPDTGLSMNDFAASVEFFKTLPSIEDPQKLRDPQFDVTPTVSADQWLGSVKQQVLKQYIAIQANPNLNGFTAAFTSPMLIKGSAKIFSIYTSEEVFNGQVDLLLSTDGKILVTGKLNFAGGAISVSGKLYADLSNVSSGKVVVLFLADIPDQVRLLSIDGKLKLGFLNSSGDDVTVTVPDSTPVGSATATTANLASPGADAAADVAVLNGATEGGDHYVDVVFTPGVKEQLDYGSILDDSGPTASELSGVLATASGQIVPLTFNPKPLPIQTGIDPNTGAPKETVLTQGATDRTRPTCSGWRITMSNASVTKLPMPGLVGRREP